MGKFLQRKITRLRPFDKIVPEAAQDHFKDLYELFGVPLYEYVTKTGGTFSAFSIKLKILGESEDTAKQWIVVLSDRGVAKRVKQFFSQSWVRSECRPCHTDPCRPSFQFEVLVMTGLQGQCLLHLQPASMPTGRGMLLHVLLYVDQSSGSRPKATLA